MKLTLVLTLAVACMSSPALAVDTAPFNELVTDPAPRSITRNAHYVISNENHAHLFTNAAADLGGVMVGVGSDQLYMYAGWYKPQVLVPMDFDRVIVDLHKAYKVIFLAAKNADEFLALWKKDAKKKVLGLIADGYADAKERARVVRAYKMGQRLIEGRFKRLLNKHEKLQVKTFLNDPAQYAFVRKLWEDGRVFPVRGDLTKDGTMKSIGEASRKANLPVRVLYMSNAEQYFAWSKSYRDNILEMNFDDKSLILRTLPDGNKGYYYYVQKAKLFQEWVKAPHVRKVFRMLRYKTRHSDPRYFTLDKLPPEPRKKKRSKKG